MSESDDVGRISVSRDALRADLGDLELRLIEKLATKAEHESLAMRVAKLEWQAAWSKGGLAVLSVLVVVLTTYVAIHG